ncbi:Transducin/WD40 repeat-like superfamily protein isoform 4 [Theobroma cacao]|uniref:Transducin/WD40 repeat-like superfamily protein isoform 4 n=1 Tax=Theobroma cacao TaxID=3641 RepID=A0A061FZ43_THECC|nr:Transducin/WD40 repeat-like superfamily protein isoform 4 [Theobroma cacao]
MEFTEAYKQTGPCCFSPNARYIAVAVDYRLVIRDTLSFRVVQLFSCLDKISYIEWALDSEYILCGLYKRPMIQAWSLTQPEWTCKIDEGPAGIAYARWSPDSRHILTTSEFQLRLTVWSLVNTACVHVQWPKHASKGVSFTKDGKFAAICTRRDCKDYINLLSCHSWEIMGVFAVDTLDLADLEWSPDDSAIVIWDSPLEYKVLIYSPDGRCLFKYQAYESGLGVKSVSWSPCGQFLAVGSYDQMLRVLNHLTWKTFAEFMHLSTVRAPCCAAVFKEVDEPLQLDMSELCLDDDFMRGSGLLSWSNDSQFICTRNDSMPTALWIWDIRHLELAAILVQKDPIRAAVWDPICTRLVLCTGSSHLYMWTASGAYCVSNPLPQFSITDLKWNRDGSCLLLKDKESFCCAAVPLLPESSDYSSDD